MDGSGLHTLSKTKMPPQPELPLAVHAELDSMLSRKFGKEIANYFAGSSLNRLSFLRTENKFLSQALRHPTTSFLLCRDLAPLVHSATQLAYVKYEDVKPLIGYDPYARIEEDVVAAYNSEKTVPQLLFLGIDEKSEEPDLFNYKIYSGAPFFALDVTPKGTTKSAAESLIASLESKNLTFLAGRVHLTLPASQAAIYSEARALLDWNARNPFCAGCGQPTLSVSAGFKRTCPPADWAESKTAGGRIGSTTAEKPSARPDCVTRKGISNLCFPRTDPTVIMAVLSHDGKRVLLGRQRRFPPHWYSTLAGFIEPGESVEEAVRREVWEESGIQLGRVIIHSTQPWSYPANLMIGCIGQAVPGGEEIVLENDPELEHARWASLEEVREALSVGTSGIGEEAGSEYVEGNLRLPPRTAIANQLLEAVVNMKFPEPAEKL